MTLLAPEDIHAARIVLAEIDPALRLVHAVIPVFGWRRRPAGFEGLMRLLIEQQISVAAAAAIWGRLEAGLGGVTPEGLLAKTDLDLRAFGFSASKVRHGRALAHATLEKRIDFDRLPSLSDADALTALTALNGVGPWTAQVYLMMCEGRSDIFPVGDIALKEAVRMIDQHTSRMTDLELHRRSTVWRPHRGVAAHMLWAYYIAVKKRDIEPPLGVRPSE